MQHQGANNKLQRNDYIRFALDGLRRSTVLPKDEAQWVSIEGANTLANFANVIAWFYEQIQQNKPKHNFDGVNQLSEFVKVTAQMLTEPGLIDETGNPVEKKKSDLRTEDYSDRIVRALPKQEVKPKYDEFIETLLRRLSRSDSDIVETAAFVTYEMINRRFFPTQNRLIAQALGYYVLMREGWSLPTYPGDKNKIRLDIDKAMASDFNTWLNFCRSLFKPIDPPRAEPADPNDAWHVASAAEESLHPSSTAFQEEYSRRRANDIARLQVVTGQKPHELVVFRPTRMALHETVAALITQVKMNDTREEIKRFIDIEPYYRMIQAKAAVLDAGFEEMARRFDLYAEFILNDRFHIISPQLNLRSKVDIAAENIQKRIQEGGYDPRAAESWLALRDLLSDDLLQHHYQPSVRNLVDEQINTYLDKNDKLRLGLKPNYERFAWVTVGGPASGKSSLKEKIEQERQRRREGGPLCRVDLDDFRELLLKRANNPSYSERTHIEAQRVTQLIHERLRVMVHEGKAPDMWLDMVKPKDPQLEIAEYGHSRLRLFVASCPAEHAVDRAWDRAKKVGGDDEGRFVPTKVILEGHQQVSKKLPETIHDRRCVLYLFDTAPDRHIYHFVRGRGAIITVKGDEFSKGLEISEPLGFLEFLKKSALNVNSENKEDTYPYTPKEVNEHVITNLLNYADRGMRLNFTYGDHIRLSDQDDARNEKDKPRYYARIGRKNAIIYDLQAFMGIASNTTLTNESLALRLLCVLATRGSLRVNGRNGGNLLVADKKLFYNSNAVEDHDERKWLDAIAKYWGEKHADSETEGVVAGEQRAPG